VKYLLLFCALLVGSWKLVDIIFALSGWNITAIKILADSLLFALSFLAQRRFVFPAAR
jgi:nicotinamide riboside transporter PnuC